MNGADDVVNLFRRFGASSAQFHEIEPKHNYREKPPTVTPIRPQAAQPEPEPAELTVDARQAQALLQNTAALEKSFISAMPPTTPARVIAVVSPKGGVGKTTLSAALAVTLQHYGVHTLALDLDPQNALQYHLSESRDAPGLATSNENWSDICLARAGASRLLPYGPANETQRRGLEHRLEDDSTWLSSHLVSLNLNASDVVIIDTPPGASVYLHQVLACADLVLVVTTPDAASYTSLTQMEQILESYKGRHKPWACRYVVNQYDPSRALSQDMNQVLQRRLGQSVIGTIHYDNVLREALAYGRSPLEQDPTAQACQDILAIAGSVRAYLMTQAAKESRIS